MKPQTQKQIILKALQDGKKLTELDMLNIAGAMAGAQRIANLRDEGYPIQTKMITTRTGKRVAEYSLI